MGIAAESHQFHVLAVDDSIIDRKLIERLLKTSSYQVTTVDSGSKALEYLWMNEYNSRSSSSTSTSQNNNNHQDVEVNLVLTDYCMPGMSGYDLLKKIKESSSLKKIPVVIMSSENIPARITRCLEEGAEEFFLKPMKLSDIKRLKAYMLKSTMMSRKDDDSQSQEGESKKKRKVDDDDDDISSHRGKPRYYDDDDDDDDDV